MNKIIPSVAILVFNKGKVLLVRHEKAAGHLTGAYGLPAGRFELHESVKHAAIRELREETGLQTKPEYLIEFPKNLYSAQIKRKGGKTKTFSMRVFICTKYSGDLRANAETTPEWINISDLDSYVLLPNVKRAITDGLKYKPGFTVSA